MSTETLFIHILWASVSSAALYVTYKCVEKYTTIKSLETLAFTSERIGAVVLQVLKESGGKFRGLPVPVTWNAPDPIAPSSLSRVNGGKPFSTRDPPVRST